MYCASINHRKEKGFTLLEVVLVLFILAIITSTSLSFIENEDSQLRFEESMRKLNILEDAILYKGSYRGSNFLSGFVVDNGALPATFNMEALTSSTNEWSHSASNYWELHGNLLPYYFDSAGNEDQINDEDYYRLDKGFRGPYISDGLDSNNEFKDGWGYDFDIRTSTISAYEFSFEDDLANPSPITGSPFNIVPDDVQKSFQESDWSISKESLNISIVNDDSNDEDFRVVVVVFSNNPNDTTTDADDDDLWQSFYFDASVTAGTSVNSSSYSWSIDAGLPNISRVPAGQHLVLLLDTDATITNHGDDVVAYSRVTVFPSTATQPEVILTYDP